MSSPTQQHGPAVRQAADQLRHAGFLLVETEVRINGARARPDVVAWAADADGRVVPWAVVEVKTGPGSKKPEFVIPQLAQYANTLGTIDNYVVIGSDWFKADQSFRRLEAVDGPSTPPFGSSGAVDDPAVIEPLLNHWLAGITHPDWLVDAPESHQLPEIDGLTISMDAYWRAARRVLANAGSRTLLAEHSSSPVIAALVAQLIGNRLHGLVLDPFCGTGSFLWAVANRVRGELEYLSSAAYGITLHGVDLDSRSSAVARAIGSASGLPTHIETGDAFRTTLPTANVILTAPPIGMRLQEPHELLNGQQTTDTDLAGVDLALRHLDKDGRAIFLLPRSFVYRSVGDKYREYLANNFRVAVLIGTPRNTIPGTSLAGVILVIDGGDGPTETFVGQAADDDWEVQLGVEGPLTKAAIDHLHSISQG